MRSTHDAKDKLLAPWLNCRVRRVFSELLSADILGYGEAMDFLMNREPNRTAGDRLPLPLVSDVRPLANRSTGVELELVALVPSRLAGDAEKNQVFLT
mmetsp:Transcript_31551/g.86949  ORF Transcript_31551/g.86949 Transcript_31551/m.86949 type:complete len:98 (+) Transcript_31551:122-415(+)